MPLDGNVDSSGKGEYLLGIILHKSATIVSINSSTSSYKLYEGYALSKCFLLVMVVDWVLEPGLIILQVQDS